MNQSLIFSADDAADPYSGYCYFPDREATEEERREFFQAMAAMLEEGRIR